VSSTRQRTLYNCEHHSQSWKRARSEAEPGVDSARQCANAPANGSTWTLVVSPEWAHLRSLGENRAGACRSGARKIFHLIIALLATRVDCRQTRWLLIRTCGHRRQKEAWRCLAKGRSLRHGQRLKPKTPLKGRRQPSRKPYAWRRAEELSARLLKQLHDVTHAPAARARQE
jgi:hypothetical protein